MHTSRWTSGALAGCLLLLLAMPGTAGSKKPQVVFRVHVEASKGMPATQVVPITLRNPDQNISVKRIPELTEITLTDVVMLPDGKVMFELNSTGKAALDAATRTSMGAVMVVLLNGRVVYAPLIDVPLPDGRLIIPPGISVEEVTFIKKYIEKRKKF
jgi:hypothetical protein